jgi:purine-binding chemotaxis protein CheW
MTSRADELRDAFDRGFAAAVVPPDIARTDMLCIRVGGQPCAIRAGDIASLHADLRVVALPSRAPELLGVAAIRATVLPIYDLAAALAMPGAGTMRWIAAHRDGQAGFAFEHYDGHARITDRALGAPAQRGHIAGQLVVGGHPRLVIDLGSVLAAIDTRFNQGGTAKER